MIFSAERSRARAARAVLAAFLVAQALDGILTYVGVATYGAGIEANPVVSWYIYAFGASAALIWTKSIAAGCAIGLHWAHRHGTVATLTALYLGVAIPSWIRVLWL